MLQISQQVFLQHFQGLSTLFVHHLDLCQTFPKLLRRISSSIYDTVSSTIAIYSQFLLGAHYLHPLCCSSLARVLLTLPPCLLEFSVVTTGGQQSYMHLVTNWFLATWPTFHWSCCPVFSDSKAYSCPHPQLIFLQHVPCAHLSASMDAIKQSISQTIPSLLNSGMCP